jgi:hypothetical protein
MKRNIAILGVAFALAINDDMFGVLGRPVSGFDRNTHHGSDSSFSASALLGFLLQPS